MKSGLNNYVVSKYLYVLLLFFGGYSVIFAQKSKLLGSWFCDRITYDNGNNLEINTIEYSMFLKYNFKPQKLIINNDHQQVYQINGNKIKTNLREFVFSFNDDYLILEEENYKFYFLSKDKYYQKYNIEDKYVLKNDSDTIFLASEKYYPEFNFSESFLVYLSKNIPSWNKYSGDRNYFKVSFLLTKEGNIKDINIENSISKEFDKQFVQVLLKSEKMWHNKTNKDLLVMEELKFFKLFGANKYEQAIFKLKLDADGLYQKNEFQNTMVKYIEILKLIENSPKGHSLYEDTPNEINKKLGIIYLAMGDKEKACVYFKSVGGIENFQVKNYIVDFCINN